MHELTINPHGHLVVREPAADSSARDISKAILEAYGRSSAQGMLYSANEALETALPPSFEFARSIARLYLTHLCRAATGEAGETFPELIPPQADFEQAVQQAPPMVGLEYLTTDALATWWRELDTLTRSEVEKHGGGAQQYLSQRNPQWRFVGRVTFHLAENKRDPRFPFAFLATFANGLTPQGKVKHEPLGRALMGAAPRTRYNLLNKWIVTSERMQTIMDDPTITCPQCKTEIKLTESLAAPMLESTRRQYEKRIADKDAEVVKRLKDARLAIAAEEEMKARTLVANDLETKGKQLADLQEVLKERDGKLAEAQKAQAELIRKQRELDDAKREMDLTIEKRVQESLSTVRDKAKQEAEEALKLRVMEKEQTITSMQKQIEELKRKAEQGSQQLQGEVQELDLAETLRSKFPHDDIDPVPKGEHGGDVIHRVIGPTQQACGTILWEAKRTKNWSDHWLTKLRGDQRAAKAEFAVIVSQALPKGIEVFDQVDGIWITSPRAVIPVSIALRHSLIELTMARQAGEGQQTKMALVYQYLTGPKFRLRIQALAEAFSTMQDDLGNEKKAIMKQWAKREQQIDLVMQATVGMYGDLQGIADKSLQEIEGLDMAALFAPTPTGESFPEMELREQAVLFQEPG